MACGGGLSVYIFLSTWYDIDTEHKNTSALPNPIRPSDGLGLALRNLALSKRK